MNPVTAPTAERRPRVVGSLSGHPLVGALSPSRASDFMQCPLKYRFRTIDRLPERPGRAAFRGTLVHEVLDRLFDLPAGDRSAEAAKSMADLALTDLLQADPQSAFALVDDAEWPAEQPPEIPASAWEELIAEAGRLLDRYFTMEDPTELEPLHREQLLEVRLDEGPVLRGYVDRIDDTHGALRVLDYKSGRSPAQQWEQQALFQLRFYALLVELVTGRIPERLQLMYLGNGEVLTYEPDAEDLRRFERKLRALWSAIEHAADSGDWRARPSRFCGWCQFQQFCPEFGGQPPAAPRTEETSITVGR